MSALATVDHLTVAFPTAQGELVTLEDVTFRVDPGEFVALVGPSGSGKSTLVRAIAGLLPPGTRVRAADAGSERSRGQLVRVAQRPDPRHRGRTVADVAWMGQKDALLPWRRALPNAMVGARIAGMSAEAARTRARELMERFGLGGFEDAWPHEMSGGMRQRLALVRTVLADRRLLLLDEPFSGLDALTRREMNAWLRETDLVALGSTAGGGATNAQDASGAPQRPAAGVVLVTHDVDEALSLADRVVVLSARPGRVVAELPTATTSHAEAEALRTRLLSLLGVHEEPSGERVRTRG